MSTTTEITVSKIFVLNVAPKTRVLDRFWYDTTNKILKKCVSADSSKTDAECWEPIGIDPSAVKVTVENGQGNSTTLDLQTYVSAVAEGLIEISGQVTNLNNTKADKTALDTKQDKLNYYNEGDNVANITSETTNTNNVVAKNITLGGYEEDILFHAGSRSKLNTETQETSQENCIFGSLVDKELSDESLETHIPTSSAVVDYFKKSAPKQTNELFCNYAAIKTRDPLPTTTPFSCVATIAMTLKEFDAHKSYSPGIMGTSGYWTDNNTCWTLNRLGSANGYIGLGANNYNGTSKYNTAYILDYLDGKPHSWLVTYNGVATLKFFIDGKQIVSLGHTFTDPYTTKPLSFGGLDGRLTGTGAENNGILGKLSRVRCFNFDISQDNPVYTIKDYNEGKEPIVGMLDNTNLTPTLNMSAVNTSDYSVDEEGNVHILTSKSLYPRIFNNVFKAGKAYKVKYTTDFYYDSPVTIKLRLPTSNAKVKCLNTGYEYYTDQLINDNNCFLYQNEGEYAAGRQKFEFEFEFIAELRTNSNANADTACVYVNPVNLESGDSYFNVEVQELAALTYLADFSVEDTKTIPDLTARHNDAKFAGEITGTQDAIIDKITGDASEAVNIAANRIKNDDESLYFFGGTNVTNNYLRGTTITYKQGDSFSFAVRVKYFKDSQVTRAQIWQFGSLYLYMNSRLGILEQTAFGSAVQQISPEDNNRLGNGEWHSLIVTYDGTTCKIHDETGLLLSVNSSVPIPTLENRGFLIGGSFVGQLKDVKLFNFDMSEPTALYTIDDYINNKDESPLLRAKQPVIGWSNINKGVIDSENPNKITFQNVKENTTYPRFLNTTATPLERGKTYEIKISKQSLDGGCGLYSNNTTSGSAIVRWVWEDLLTGEKGSGENTSYCYNILPFSSEDREVVEATIWITPRVDNLIPYLYVGPSDETIITVHYAKVNGATLSLLNSLIENEDGSKTALDISGNANHLYKDPASAGSVYGENDLSNKLTIKSYIQPTIDEINEKIEEVENIAGDLSGVADIVDQRLEQLGRQIIVNTHSDSFASTDVTFVSIYTDESKAALPGRIMIQPKLSNVAPMYFGENVSDKTKAFPLYPDQITDFYFEDINNFKVASDAVGDGCNFVIEWGVTNVVADIASAFTMYDDNGNKFKIKIANGGLVAEQLN